MASVTLLRLFVHDTVDLSRYVAVWVNDGAPEVVSQAKRVMFAAGNSRVVRRAGVTDDITYRLVDVPRPDALWLTDNVGALLLFRDPRGGKRYGFFESASLAELPGVGQTVDLDIAVQQVTYVEAVDAA